MPSFFKKLRKLLECQKEDYLTEVFAFALQQDKVFRTNFLHLLPKEYRQYSSFFAETQSSYRTDSRRTDLEINLGDAYIIVESKLGHAEGENQLDHYAQLLSRKRHSHKLLLFLTANREPKSKNYENIGVSFLELRWQAIGNCITDGCETITNELKQYLIDEKIIVERINYNDVVAFQNFFDFRRKMNDILQNDVSKLYTQTGLHRFNTWQPTTGHNEYVINFNYGKSTTISLGFGNWWGDHPCVFTRVWLDKRTDANEGTAKSMLQHLPSHWYIVDTNEHGFAVETREPLVKYLILEDDQREHIVQFYEECIHALAALKAFFPKIFNKAEKPEKRAQEAAV